MENFRANVLKIGHFYWLRVKNSNYLHAEFSLGYLGDAKFYLESKASFIDISSIASFKVTSHLRGSLSGSSEKKFVRALVSIKV